MTPQLEQVLRDAAQLIREKGWTRGSYKVDGRYCAVGALREVASAYDYDRALAVLADRVRAQAPGTVSLTSDEWAVTKWNDRQKTRRPVLALLEQE